MSQPPPTDSPLSVRKLQLPGMLVFFIVVLGSLYLAHYFQEPVMQRFALHGGSPGDSPPWYFMTRNFAEGICSAGALLLCLLAAVASWRWWPSYASMMVWMPLLLHGGNITRSWIIYQSCPGLLDGQRITSRWPTYQSYVQDHDIARANLLIMISAVVLALVLPLADQYIRYRVNRRSARMQNARRVPH